MFYENGQAEVNTVESVILGTADPILARNRFPQGF